MIDRISYLIGDSLARKIALALYVILAVWWGILFFWFQSELAGQNLVWGASYQLLAILGLILGWNISRRWGGAKSVMGRALLLFALGLGAQVFGQTVFSFYNLVLKVGIPYPSLADVGYFGSIPLYIYGTVLIGRASGLKVSLRLFSGKIQAVLVPLAILAASYAVFLTGYEFDWSDPIRIFLDLGYPFGQAIYISLALLVFLLSRGVLGGMMRPKVLYMLIALFIQYIADFNFLYQATHETWVNGGYGDFIYLTAYFAMALGLISFGSVFNRIKEGN